MFVRNGLKFKVCLVPRLFDETSAGSRLEDLRHHEDTAKIIVSYVAVNCVECSVLFVVALFNFEEICFLLL